MSRKNKRPFVAQQPARGKTPAMASSPSPARRPRSLGIDHDEVHKRTLVWRFGDFDGDFPPAAGSLTVKHFLDLHEKLGGLETQTVAEVFGPADNGCKVYPFDGLPDHTWARLVEIDRDDETELHCLRVTAKFRVHGFLRQNVFYVLWIDPEHEVWPSAKRNT